MRASGAAVQVLLVTHLGFVLLLVTHLGPFLFVQCSFHHDTHRDFIDFMWEFLLALLHLCYMRIRTYRKRDYRDLTDPVLTPLSSSHEIF